MPDLVLSPQGFDLSDASSLEGLVDRLYPYVLHCSVHFFSSLFYPRFLLELLELLEVSPLTCFSFF